MHSVTVTSLDTMKDYFQFTDPVQHQQLVNRVSEAFFYHSVTWFFCFTAAGPESSFSFTSAGRWCCSQSLLCARCLWKPNRKVKEGSSFFTSDQVEWSKAARRRGLKPAPTLSTSLSGWIESGRCWTLPPCRLAGCGRWSGSGPDSRYPAGVTDGPVHHGTYSMSTNIWFSFK